MFAYASAIYEQLILEEKRLLKAVLAGELINIVFYAYTIRGQWHSKLLWLATSSLSVVFLVLLVRSLTSHIFRVWSPYDEVLFSVWLVLICGCMDAADYPWNVSSGAKFTWDALHHFVLNFVVLRVTLGEVWLDFESPLSFN